MTSYSQFGQDVWVLEKLNHKCNGYFIDVGAGHPSEISNTLLLEQDYGWTGLLIEPDQIFFNQLVENRTSICIQKCIYCLTQPMQYYHTRSSLTNEKGFGNTLEPFKNRDPNDPMVSSETVITETLTSILKQYDAPTTIDYLDIDVEGAELDVVQSIDFSTYLFHTITIEANRQQEPIMRLLRSYGYKLNKIAHENLYITGPEL